MIVGVKVSVFVGIRVFVGRGVEEGASVADGTSVFVIVSTGVLVSNTMEVFVAAVCSAPCSGSLFVIVTSYGNNPQASNMSAVVNNRMLRILFIGYLATD